MVGVAASTAALLALAGPASGAPAPAPISYVVYVGTTSGQCVFMTGDVLFNARAFRRDLKESFSRGDRIMIYHAVDVRHSCVATARRIIRELGFTLTSVEEAPKDLDMGPPR